MNSETDVRDLARDLMNRHRPGRTSNQPPARRRRGLEGHPLIEQARSARQTLAELTARGVANPFFVPHDGVSGPTIDMLGRQLINFSTANYLGLGYHPQVVAAAKEAIDQYGMSVSAGRAVSGEIPLYSDLEQRLAGAYGVDDAVITTSGYLANAAMIAFLLTSTDLAVCDALVHSSVVAGTQWAQCRRVMFRHNDPESLAAILRRMRGSAERAMVIVEGAYSMDGDIVALPEVLCVAREFDCLVMVDEAHSFGTVGEHGWGVRERYGLPGDAVDVWMGTLSKSLASCGGFLAGNGELMWAIRLLGPGLGLFIAPPTPAQVAASIAAFDVLRAEPQRVDRLRVNAAHALAVAHEAGWDTGASAGTPIVPLIIGDTIATIELSTWLWQNGVNASPIPQAAVGDGQDRIRLFLSSDHTPDQIARLGSLLGQYRAAS
ncbi:aminotransferase class I/II-fold pyridoxal phosphate-dependent enzyme [Mycobacterium riyadhense]|uniref:aminotransferase class I/II-fold pyridoxal phosphate-dependent enzyme n=1 Tax=Mycobacterium riyadhense TaxID=486698 RepID=UPI00195093A3|nr:aminotransferase class I/II-fold pyridoxal phosphate-dependent enzyme [Mycobacterium riyadhense]